MGTARSWSKLVVAAVALVLTLTPAGASAAPRTPVRIIVPKLGNLQYLSFWVAQGGGLFEAEGLDVTLSIPDVSAGAPLLLMKKDAEIAVLPPPQYLQMIATGEPLVLVANLLQNDPINLVVRRTIFEERKLDASAPLLDRLKGIHGLRVGVAYGPPTRLRALFASQGLDADRDITILNFHGKEQNAAFENNDVDALYAHTPYVERALIDQDAVLLVNQSAGEVPELADRQIHAIVVTRPYLEANRPIVTSIVRAIYRAQKLVHADRAATVNAVMRALPSMERSHVELIVAIYEPAIPKTPRVAAESIQRALDLFPASKQVPDLSKVDLRRHVAPEIAEQVIAEDARTPSKVTARGAWWWTAWAGALAAIAAALVFGVRRARRAARAE